MHSSRPELGARLDHVALRSSDPERLASFLETAYGMQRFPIEGGWRCAAPQRTLLAFAGPANRTAWVAFAFDDATQLAAHRARLERAGIALRPNPSPLFAGVAHAVVDPEGNCVAFGVRDPQPRPLSEGDAASGEVELPARLQHLALRTPRLDAMVAFYSALGFVVSDRVKDEAGELRACFLRSDAEHHALALFKAAEARFDHLSCETRDTSAVIAWADRMAQRHVPIHWGIGRHGPGNDVFFMVQDPEGNLFEISAELEVCAAQRTAGTWRHEPRTLNLWGTAIMRS